MSVIDDFGYLAVVYLIVSIASVHFYLMSPIVFLLFCPFGFLTMFDRDLVRNMSVSMVRPSA